MALYDAFISYSHSKDKPIAAALQHVVQRLGKPWYRRRALRVFRDDTSLSATPHLWPTIEQALGESRFLILLASPEAAASPWVGKEIEYWLAHKSADTLLVALTDGTLVWDNAAGDFQWTSATPLPPVLKGAFAAEPKWVDLCAYLAGAPPRDAQFEELGADFAAAIRGIPKEDLLSQELRQQRRMLRLAWSAAGALLVFFGVAAWQWQRAEVQRNRAERNLTAATGTANTLVFELAQEFRDRGLPVDLVRKLLSRARDLQRQLVSSGEMSPALLNSEAAALCELSTTLRAQGDLNEALEAAETCRAVMERLLADSPDNNQWKRQLAASYQAIGDALRDAGRREEALEAYRKSLAIRATLAAGSADVGPRSDDARSDLAISDERIGDLLAIGGQREAALDEYRQSLALIAGSADQGNTDARQHVAVIYNKIGDTLAAAGQREQALEAYRQGLAVTELLAAAEPDNTRWQSHLAFAWSNIGDLSAGEEALAAYRKALTIRERLAAGDPDNAPWQRDLAASLSNVGDALLRAEKAAEALGYYRRSLAVLEKLSAATPDNPQWLKSLSIADNKIGDILAGEEKWDEALTSYRRALAVRERLATADTGNADRQYDLAFSQTRVGRALVALGQSEPALASFRSAIAILEKLIALDPGNLDWLHMLSVDLNVTGDLLAALNRPDEAMECYRKDLAIALKIAAVDPGNPAWQHDLWLSYYRIGQKEAGANRPDAARTSYAEAMTIIETLAASQPDNAGWQVDLVATLVALAPFRSDALDYYKRALAILQRLDAEGQLPASKKAWISILERGIASLQK